MNLKVGAAAGREHYTCDSSGNVLDLTEYTDGSPTARTTFAYSGSKRTFAKREDRQLSLENDVLSEFYDEHSNCTRRIGEVAETKMSGAVVTKPVRSEFSEIGYYRL